MEIIENKSLKDFNTFGIDVRAKYFVEIINLNDIIKLLDNNVFINHHNVILGAGSNLLFTEDFDGLIIYMNIKGVSIKESNDDYLILEVGAGEEWSKLVETCVKSNYYGLENLAMIPGKVGAAPVQNIGAYGSEQKDCFVSLTAVDMTSKEIQQFCYDECEFAYRSSLFKTKLNNRFIITSVQYKLSRNESFNFSYKELDREVHKFPINKIDLRYVFDTVCRLREKKLPNPQDLGNAGSFFKNPVVSADHYYSLLGFNVDMPGYPVSEHQYKLSAGWLIENAGWKGKRVGDAGVYENHALILVNYGVAKGSEIKDLSDEIIKSVYDKFGMELQPEVIII